MEKIAAIVTRVRRESPDVVTIYFLLQNRAKLDYEAGQYITVYFENSSAPEGKAYSLSSAPHEKWMSITVKKIGEYSGRLHALRAGDVFAISEAYGFFNPRTSQPIVAISAGCGIAPLWSIIKDEYWREKARIAHVFYTNKTADDILFQHEISDLHAQHPDLSVAHYITRQPELGDAFRIGRIDIDAVAQLGDEARYLVCGSVEFVKDMWVGLMQRGIGQNNISTETFFE